MFRVDLRSLAAFRIAVSLILLWDLVVRARDLEAHYTDAGVLPRTVLFDNFLALRPYFSVHILMGTALFEAILFCLAGLCAVALLLGFRSRIACAACWFLTCSLHARNPLVLHGGDDLLRLLLFWAMFVPLGGRWSVDRGRASAVVGDDHAVCSWGTAGLMLQLCFMYIFSAALKSHPSWRREGTAVYLALSLDQFATPLGRALLPFHGLLTVMTFSTVALELAGPYVALYSYLNARLRVAVIAMFVLFHIGLGLCIELGIFPAVCIAGWLVFVPARLWDRIEPRLSPALVRWPRWLPEPVTALARRGLQRVRPRTLHLRIGRLGNAAACASLLTIVAWNLRATDFKRFSRVFPASWSGPVELLRIDQYWNLFAPYPSLEHGWYVLDARLRGGREVDLATGRPVRWDRPALVSATYRNERWRKYLMNLATDQFASYRPYFAQYLQRSWNDSHGAAERIARLEIVFVTETALPNYRIWPQRRVRLWSQEWTE
jgi:hypothetical protein